MLIVPVRLARQVRTAHDHGSEARHRGRVAHGPRNLRAAVRRVRTATAVEQVHQARPRCWRSAIRSTRQSPLPKLVAANDRGHVRGCEGNEHQQRARRRRGQRRARGRARGTRALCEHLACQQSAQEAKSGHPRLGFRETPQPGHRRIGRRSCRSLVATHHHAPRSTSFLTYQERVDVVHIYTVCTYHARKLRGRRPG